MIVTPGGTVQYDVPVFKTRSRVLARDSGLLLQTSSDPNLCASLRSVYQMGNASTYRGWGIPHLMKVQAYSLDDIFEKRLLMLIPFYIFSHESRLPEYNKDERKLAGFQTV